MQKTFLQQNCAGGIIIIAVLSSVIDVTALQQLDSTCTLTSILYASSLAMPKKKKLKRLSSALRRSAMAQRDDEDFDSDLNVDDMVEDDSAEELMEDRTLFLTRLKP